MSNLSFLCFSDIQQQFRQVWSYYLEMGSQSWTSISDTALRRRVGLRFMHRLLQLDPPAYRVRIQDSDSLNVCTYVFDISSQIKTRS